MSDLNKWTNGIHTGDARDTLAEIPDSSIHMVMTSPPYFGLRDYGVDDQIGLEDELDTYIKELVGVFREVRRVLRPDGSAWLNLGDSYAGSGTTSNENFNERTGNAPGDRHQEQGRPDKRIGQSLGRKNKMLVPHRVAIALQSDGWVVRNDVTWVKPNPMPSSVKDRLNTTTEQLFHLVPEPDYWYDLDAIREPHSDEVLSRSAFGDEDAQEHKRGTIGAAPDRNDTKGGEGVDNNAACDPAGKNPGDVFEVTTKPFPEAHFAVYPRELVEKPLKATCPPKVCAECGSPYERDVERTTYHGEHGVVDEKPQKEVADTKLSDDGARRNDAGRNLGGRQYNKWKANNPDEFKGWNPTCDCDTDATEPGIALDPFAGAGTTCLVAKEHGRRFIGIDLNEKYVAMAQKRLRLTVDKPEHVRDDGDAGLEDFA